jgi:SAM-dependent methyltransferase
LAKEFQRSQIIGIGPKPLRADICLPINCSFETVDLYDDPRLPFPNGYFDFVRHRIVNMPVRPENQQAYICECARVTAPGGWVELAQWQGFCEYAGSATAHWHNWFINAMQMRIADTYYIDQVDELMCNAGLVDVEKREFLVPIGSWAGTAGHLGWLNIAEGTELIAEELANAYGVRPEVILDLLPRMQREVEEHRSRFSFVVYFGRKPDPMP